MDVTILEEKLKTHTEAMNKFIDAIKQYPPSDDIVKYYENTLELFRYVGYEHESMHSAMYFDFIIPLKNAVERKTSRYYI